MSAETDEAAARWHLAQADDDMDWMAFAEWLEADPRHREAYDAIALLDARIDAARPMLSRLLPAEPMPRRAPRIAVWGAIAAVLIAVIAIGILRWPQDRTPETIAYRAPMGQPRDVRLADGSTATLAPGSILRVARSRDVPMTLEGNAFFDVRHDAAHPMVVQAGGYEIRDVGTRFEVSTSGGMVRVAVAEGRVAVRSPHVAGEVEVGAGKALTLTGAGDPADLRPARAQSVGAWRKGALVYDDVPLAMVAADIARSTGRPVTIDPAVARRRFSGVIAPGDRTAMVAALGELTGLKTRTDGDAIRLGDSAGR
ncbi:MAG: FecR domain-containing protein [Sphingomonas sp.]|jgi:transmembrane sensor|uniref:FecR family protein n=1 Tax=Sphingomonas sp. TaxID=28214 RepID=UPI003562932F